MTPVPGGSTPFDGELLKAQAELRTATAEDQRAEERYHGLIRQVTARVDTPEQLSAEARAAGLGDAKAACDVTTERWLRAHSRVLALTVSRDQWLRDGVR